MCGARLGLAFLPFLAAGWSAPAGATEHPAVPSVTAPSVLPPPATPPEVPLSSARANPTAQPVRPPKDTKIKAGELLGHIQYLSSKALRGREAGTIDERRAARYIANEFKRYGLQPFGDKRDGGRGYLQMFDIPVSKGVGRHTALKLLVGERETVFAVQKQFVPLPAGEGDFRARGGVAFAGYGIAAPEYQYDDFAGLNLAGKWALVLRYEPQARDPKSKFRGARHTPHAQFASKIRQCVSRQAVGVLIVNGPPKQGGPPEPLRKASGSLLGDFHVPVFQLTREAADAILAPAGKKIAALQAALDRDLRNRSFSIKGARIEGRSELDLDPHPTANVIARLPGRDEKLKSETVLIGAHCDHVGLGRFGSLAGRAGLGKIHPGADDNASGTAAVLEIAQYFAALQPERRPRRSLLFLAFSGEEKGLLGSQYYVRRPSVPLRDTVAMLNLDMIGRSVNGAVQVSGVGTGTGFRALVNKEGKDPALRVYVGSGGLAPSDNTSFYRKKIPVLFFFTGAHADYHRPGDTWDKINAPAAAAITRMIRRLLLAIAENPERPKFIENGARGFLGVGVDRRRMRSAKGFPVGSVAPGSPAAQAGIQPGDLIVGVNARPLSGALGLAMALIGFAPGDSLKLKIQHKAETRTVQVTLGRRGASR